MGLFAGEPAGVQIRRWLTILVFLVVFIDALAAASLVVHQRSVVAIQSRYQPVLTAAADITAQVFQAQSSLYKYLGEYLPDTGEVRAKTDALKATLDDALQRQGGEQWEADLRGIQENLSKYRVVVASLPPIGTKTDWTDVNEFRDEARRLGLAMESQASTLKAKAGMKIQERTARLMQLYQLSVYLFFFFLGLSLVITVLLYFWWRRFEDEIINL